MFAAVMPAKQLAGLRVQGDQFGVAPVTGRREVGDAGDCERLCKRWGATRTGRQEMT